MRSLFLILLLTPWCDPLIAQTDSTSRAYHDSLWLRQRSDGRISHDRPPAANVVASGYALVHSATTRRDAWWLRIGGALLAGTLYAADEQRRLAAPLAIAGAAFTYSVVLDFRGTKSLRYAGYHLKSGYSVTTRYDIVPDELGEGPHTRLLLQPTARMSRKDRRELETVKRAMEILNGNR